MNIREIKYNAAGDFGSFALKCVHWIQFMLKHLKCYDILERAIILWI